MPEVDPSGSSQVTVLVLGSADLGAAYVAALKAVGYQAHLLTYHSYESMAIGASDRARLARAELVLVASRRGLSAIPSGTRATLAVVGAGTAASARELGLAVGPVAADAATLIARCLEDDWIQGSVVALGPERDSRLFAAIQDHQPLAITCIPVYRRLEVDPVPALPVALPVSIGVLLAPSALGPLADRPSATIAEHWVVLGRASARTLPDTTPVIAMTQDPAGVVKAIDKLLTSARPEVAG